MLKIRPKMLKIRENGKAIKLEKNSREDFSKIYQIPEIPRIFVSNHTVSRRINEISLNIQEQVVDDINKSPFAIQLDESLDVSQFSQLLAFVRGPDG